MSSKFRTPPLGVGREGAELVIPAGRAALVVREIEGLSTREAAEIAAVCEAAFKSRLHQARLRVRAPVGDAALLASAD